MLRAHRKLTFTRDGKYFVALTLGIGFAAINTGNNLLYLILGMMLALIIGSGVLSEISLRGLEVSRRIPQRIFAGKPFLMGINLCNTKKKMPSFSIEVEDIILGQPLDKKCYFLKIPAGRTQKTAYRHTLTRRGSYTFTACKVSTKFPFALFHKSRQLSLQEEAIVFPAIYPVLPPQGHSSDTGDSMAGRLDRRGDFFALRDYQEGDDPRDIHWRKSARTDRLMIRQYEQQYGRRIAIFLDNYQQHEVLSPDDLNLQERAVSHAASLAAHYIQLGYAVQLVTRTVSIAPGSGPTQLTSLLRALALIEFIDHEAPFAAPARWTGECIFVGPVGAGAPPKAA
jgi:uncharacterized protein (DUF58 family)